MRRSQIFVLTLLLLATPLSAKTLTGEGYGKSQEQARKRALADLAAAVQVEVKSETASHCEKVRGKPSGQKAGCSFEEAIRTQSDLPLLGVRFESLPVVVAGERGQSATLDSVRATGLYRTELNALRRNMLDREKALEAAKDNDARYRLLNEQLTDARQYQYRRYRAVATILGDRGTLPAPASEAELSARLIALEKGADSIPFAARQLARGFKRPAVYVHPPRHRDAVEITPFAAAFRDALAGNLKSVARRDKAQYLMTGEYQILDDGDIHVSYQLIDRRGKIIATRGVRLDKQGWRGFRAEPLAPDLDRLIHQGVAVSNEFRVVLGTDRGSRDLLFREGETVRPEITMSRPGYYYIVGHVAREGEQYSFLLDRGEGEGGEGAWRFLRYLSLGQVNRPAVLGEFVVCRPFGVEHLQLIAASESLEGSVPQTRWDKTLGYHVLTGSQGDAGSGVVAARGLRPKSTQKTASAEADLTFTTLPGKNGEDAPGCR